VAQKYFVPENLTLVEVYPLAEGAGKPNSGFGVRDVEK
jgi:hypothetical protein